jgi:hypothetical protein
MPHNGTRPPKKRRVWWKLKMLMLKIGNL